MRVRETEFRWSAFPNRSLGTRETRDERGNEGKSCFCLGTREKRKQPSLGPGASAGTRAYLRKSVDNFCFCEGSCPEHAGRSICLFCVVRAPRFAEFAAAPTRAGGPRVVDFWWQRGGRRSAGVGRATPFDFTETESLMKRQHATLGLLSLAVLGICAPQGSAFWFCKDRGYLKYSTYIVCRPYNAFSPICSGSITCDGCCPSFGGCLPMGGCGYSPMCAPPMVTSPLCFSPPCCPSPPVCCDPCATGTCDMTAFYGGPRAMYPQAGQSYQS